MVGGIERFRERRPAGVADQHVDTAEFFGGARHQLLYYRVFLQITGEGHDLGLRLGTYRGGGLIQISLRAAAHDHFHAFFGQHFCARAAQSLACAADDGHFVFQFKIHDSLSISICFN